MENSSLLYNLVIYSLAAILMALFVLIEIRYKFNPAVTGLIFFIAVTLLLSLVDSALRKRSRSEALKSFKDFTFSYFEFYLIFIFAAVSYLSSDLLKWVESKNASNGNVRVIGKFPVNIAEDIEVLGPITIDAREGPVIIGERAMIEPYAYLKGPLHIGSHSIVVAGSRVAGSYIGVYGRAGGEVTTSIISDYSNKYHFGFLGHSYVGRWVNIGAGSTTSNLKNTYGEIKVGDTSTGLNKLGAFIGDHSKLSIGTLTYAGIRIGVSSHLHGLVYEDVSPFTIYAKSIGWGLYELDLDSVIRTYKKMAPRRGAEPDPLEEELLRKLFKDTKDQRLKNNVIRGRLKIK